MLIPRVVGFKLNGDLPEGATATDLVLTITEMLRKHGVVGKFVEFYGPGVSALPLANRATIGNMSPEFGSTIAVFPIDQQTLDYLELTGRSGRAARAGRGLREGAGPLARPGRRAALLRAARARPVHRRPEPRRPQAPAGPRRPLRRQGVVPRRARRLRRRERRRGRVRRGRRGVLPRLRLAEPRVTATAPRRRPTTWAAGATGAGRPSNPATITIDGTSSRSTTARSRSRRSPAAPTPPTRR